MINWLVLFSEPAQVRSFVSVFFRVSFVTSYSCPNPVHKNRFILQVNCTGTNIWISLKKINRKSPKVLKFQNYVRKYCMEVLMFSSYSKTMLAKSVTESLEAKQITVV